MRGELRGERKRSDDRGNVTIIVFVGLYPEEIGFRNLSRF